MGRRLAYAMGFLAAMVFVAAGVSIRSQPVDGQALLISVAEAMAEAETVHLWGHHSKGSPEGSVMSENSYEEWWSPHGMRSETRDPQGKLLGVRVHNVESGMVWYYSNLTGSSEWFAEPIVTVYRAKPVEVATTLEVRRERMLEPQLRFAEEKAYGNEVVVREKERDGKAVTIAELTRRDDAGAVFLKTVYEIDPATNRLLSAHTSGPDCLGNPPLSFFEVLDYGSSFPASMFEFEIPAGAVVMDGNVQHYGDNIIVLPSGLLGFSEWCWLPTRDDWRACASPESGSSDPRAIVDGDRMTGWTGRGRHHLQERGMWVQVDFGSPVSASMLTVHHAPDPVLGCGAEPEVAARSGDAPKTRGAIGGGAGPPVGQFYMDGAGWPRGLQVSITSDGESWEDVPTGLTRSHRPTGAVFGSIRQIQGIRLTLTESSDEASWSITEIRLH